MKKLKVIGFVSLLIMLMLVSISCKKETNQAENPDINSEEFPFTDLNVPDDFTWNTAKFLEIELNFVDNNDEPVSTDFEIYSEFPGGIKFMNGNADSAGLFKRNYKVAAYRKSFAVVVPGQETVRVEFDDIEITVGNTLAPGYSAKQTIQVESPGFKAINEDTFQYYPAEEQFGTIAFEDTWPHQADYDFNDVVIDYNIMATFNDDDLVSAINMVLYLRASGANSQEGRGNGLGISFKHAWSFDGPYPDIQSLTINGDFVTPEATDYPSYILIQNIESIQPTYNTFTDQAFEYPLRFEVLITFNTPAEDWWEIDLPLNNLFIFDALDRGRETHLPWYLPTSLANPEYAGMAKDASDEFAFDPLNFKAGNMMGFMTYMTEDYYPWGLNIYFDQEGDNLFRYPIEFMDIREAYYPAFDGWVENWDPEEWYLPEYRVEGKVFETIPDPVYDEMN